ncbi:MAG: YfhO family protein [Deltaproteobacteria bacterium]|nr:YfhO family protein [Deltaproteobacteria bacterium]
MRIKKQLNENLSAFLLYIVAISILYSPVVFMGKSLQPPLYQPYGVTDGWAYGYKGRLPADTFNIDLATPAYYEWPINKLIGDLYKNGELPLWNPYQAGGTALLAQYSTRALFPYQILEDISPVSLWDFFILGRLLIAGFFTFLFLRLIGLDWWPSFTGGFIYMFSGSFTWFINLEQFANAAMCIPLFLYSLERLSRGSATAADAALAAAATALVLLAGQPEMAVYIILLGACYYAFRIASSFGKTLRCLKKLLLFIPVMLLGLGLSAPLILPFIELMLNSYHIHPIGGTMGTVSPLKWQGLMEIFTPNAFEVPQRFLSKTIQGLTIEGEPFYFRISPANGAWDYTGGYIGVAPLLIALTGILLFLSSKNRKWLPYILFFLIFGLSIILKNLNVRPFLYLGYLPLFDQAWSQRWAGPVWTFSFAAAGALGLQIIKEHLYSLGASYPAKGGYIRPLTIFTLGITVYLSIVFQLLLALKKKLDRDFSQFGLEPVTVTTIYQKVSHFWPSFFSSIAITIIFIIAATAAFIYCSRNGKGFYGLISLCAIELWWAVPRAYSAPWTTMKIIPLLFGLLATAALLLEKRLLAGICFTAFLVSFLWLDSNSPRGFPERYNPFTEAPYIEFIRTNAGHNRVMAGHGMLFPNFASAAGIHDIRYINALAIAAYQDYRHNYLNPVKKGFSDSLWFSGATLDYPEDYFFSNLRHYSFLGVKYLILPDELDLNFKTRAFGTLPTFPLVYRDSNTSIYENPLAIERVFVASDVEYASSYKDAQETASLGSRDPKEIIVLEEKAPDWFRPNSKQSQVSARIVEYKANRVEIKTQTKGNGVLVLTDTYYPGWKAYVDGKPAKIYRVNGLVRGVFLNNGEHTVIFSYLPLSFTAGSALSLVSLSIIITLLWKARGKGQRNLVKQTT